MIGDKRNPDWFDQESDVNDAPPQTAPKVLREVRGAFTGPSPVSIKTRATAEAALQTLERHANAVCGYWAEPIGQLRLRSLIRDIRAAL